MHKKNYFSVLLSILIILTIVSRLYGQPYYNQLPKFIKANNVWAWPNHSGLDFSSGRPVGIRTAMPSPVEYEGAASVADPATGKLLFYSNGDSCWNADHKPMPNGHSLLGNSDLLSATQGVLIVPSADNPQQYYLFSLCEGGNRVAKGNIQASLFYSIVDMSLDNGRGDILTSAKNIPLDTTSLSEAMIAVPGGACDIWLIVHDAFTPVYKAYRITKNGIDTKPVLSVTNGAIMPLIPGMPPPFDKNIYGSASMAVTPDRKLIALSSSVAGLYGGLLLAKFNEHSGVVSDEIQIGASLFSSGFGAAFSPDNTKLYVSEAGAGICQYNVSTLNAVAIDASRFPVAPANAFLEYLRLYKDTIYCGLSGNPTLATINQPNNPGATCGYLANSINLFAATPGGQSLPTEVVYPMPPDTLGTVLLDTLICSGWEEGLQLNPEVILADGNYEWSSTSTDTTLVVFESGTHWVRYLDGCTYRTDTFKLKGANLPPPEININILELGTTIPYATYQWILNGELLPGAVQSKYTVTENGAYQVIAGNEYGCLDTSEVYNVTNAPISILSPDIPVPIAIYPNPASTHINIQTPIPVQCSIFGPDGRSILLQKTGAQTIDITPLARGIYFLQVDSDKGHLLKVVKFIKD